MLDVGCVNHTLAATELEDWRHAQIKAVAKSVAGLDYEKEAVEALRKRGENVFCGDAQNFDLTKEFPDGFEVIVASEIIEHLVSPGSFIQCARRHLAPGGELIVTTPHACGYAFFLETLIFGEEKINDDHTVSFTGKQMRWLMKKCGMVVSEFHWLIQDSSNMPVHTTVGARIAAKIFFWLQCIAATIRPYFSKEMIVVVTPA